MAVDLTAFDGVLLDLDGTIYHEEHPLPGAIELIRRLQRQGRVYACLSNSTSSPQWVAQRLKRMGVEVEPGRIWTAAAAAGEYILARVRGRKPRVYNLATEAVHDMLDDRVEWVQRIEDPCDAIIVGAPANVFATNDRQRVALELLRRGATLVGICADRVYPSPRGLEFGAGAHALYLGYAAGVTPVFCGKPETIFFHELCERLAVAPDRCVLVGDNLESDIGGAKRVGMRTILTLTGVATREDVARLAASARPDWIVNDLAEL